MIGPKWPQSRLCAHCGASFLVRADMAGQRCCSQSCAASAKRRTPWVACQACATRFPPRSATQRFCSADCAGRPPVPARSCGWCQKPIARPRRPQRFCSQRCAALDQHHGEPAVSARRSA